MYGETANKLVSTTLELSYLSTPHGTFNDERLSLKRIRRLCFGQN